MRNLTALLTKGNLTPKERVLLWAAYKISEDKEGKRILTEADEHALVRSWTPKDNHEVKEYNRYNDGWQRVVFMRMDAQTIYHSAKIMILQVHRIMDLILRTPDENLMSTLARIFDQDDIDEAEAQELVLQNSGFELDKTIYYCAFESLSDDLKKDILMLYPEAKTESDYLDQQEVLAGLLAGKNGLTQDKKEEIADMVVESMRNKYARSIGSHEGETQDWWLGNYYADIPTLEIAQRCAEDNRIEYQKEKEDLNTEIARAIQEWAEKHKVDAGVLLKRSVLKWLDGGLLIDEYAPLYKSKDKKTCNDADTKLAHDEIFRQWLAAKAKAKGILQKMIDDGEITVESKESECLGVRETVSMLTGESLYEADGDGAFITDFKKQTDELMLFGKVVLFLRLCRFWGDHKDLLAFAEIFKRISKIYEIDVGYKIPGYIDDLEREMRELKLQAQMIAEKLMEVTYRKHNIVFLTEMFIEDMLVITEKQSSEDENAKHYFGEFKKLFGEEFSSQSGSGDVHNSP